MYFQSTKIYSGSTKGYFQSTQMYFRNTKVYFQSAKVYSRVQRYTLQVQKYTVKVQVYFQITQVYFQKTNVYSGSTKVYCGEKTQQQGCWECYLIQLIYLHCLGSMLVSFCGSENYCQKISGFHRFLENLNWRMRLFSLWATTMLGSLVPAMWTCPWPMRFSSFPWCGALGALCFCNIEILTTCVGILSSTIIRIFS